MMPRRVGIVTAILLCAAAVFLGIQSIGADDSARIDPIPIPTRTVPPNDQLEIAGPAAGSGTPTEHAANGRVVLTAGGRLLVTYGSHAEGPRLAWRDAGATTFTHRTIGDSLRGKLLERTGTGDWFASMGLAVDREGAEHVWVVMSRGVFTESGRSILLRRISDLDSPAGPRIGPLVEVAPDVRSAKRADIGFEATPDGHVRGAIVYATDDGGEKGLDVVWFTDLDTDEPDFHDPYRLTAITTDQHTGILVEGAEGLRIVAAVPPGELAVFDRRDDGPPSAWDVVARGPEVARGATSFTSIDDGGAGLVVALQRDPTEPIVEIHHIDADTDEEALRLTGYRQPVLTGVHDDLVLVMVRADDGAVVARTRGADGDWSTQDRVLLDGSFASGRANWPNAYVAGGQLHVLVGGRVHPRFHERSAVVYVRSPAGQE